MKRNIIVFLFFSIFIFGSVFALTGPVVHHTEEIQTTYYANGSESLERIGYIEVEMPNTDDVLQQVLINLSGTQNTNLVRPIAYHSIAASATPGSKTRMYVDTAVGDKQLYYEINNSNVAPKLELNATYANKAGGIDLYCDDNIPNPENIYMFTFDLYNPSQTLNLGNAYLEVRFNTDTDGAGKDAINLTEYPVGTTILDRDSDGFYDTLVWNGTLNSQSTRTFQFNGTIEENVNFVGTTVNLNGFTTDVGVVANYTTETKVFSGINITDRFARAPVRHGIDMIYASNQWRVRGFMKDIATTSGTQLNYIIHDWNLYETNATTGLPILPAKLSFTGSDPFAEIYAPDTVYTDWYNTGAASKPYYSVEFDWEVEWDNSTYSGDKYFSTTRTELEMPTLKMIDIDNSLRDVTGVVLPNISNVIEVHEDLKHVGEVSLETPYVELWSMVPYQSTDNTTYGNWVINTSSIHVYYVNSTGSTVELNTGSSGISVTTSNPTGSSDGYVHLVITNLSQVSKTIGGSVGNYLRVNERIQIDYDVITQTDIVFGKIFVFDGNATVVTVSGTPLTELLPPREVVAAEKRLNSYKEIISYNPSNPTLVNVTILMSSLDKSIAQSGIAGIKLTDYVANGTTFNINNAVLQYYNGATWTTWTQGVEYLVRDLGWNTLPDGSTVHAYEYYDNATNAVWNGTMYDNHQLKITYQMNITEPGVYELPAQIVAFDPSTGVSLDSTAIGAISIALPDEALEFSIIEEQATIGSAAVVGKPVLWTKKFEIYNPNNRRIGSQFQTKVFDDALEANILYYDEYGKLIEEKPDFDILEDGKYIFWSTTMNPLETRTYEVRILTPPVLEIDRDVEVLEKLDDKQVKIKTDIYLKNFAEEEYSNIRLNLPFDINQILSITDDMGREFEYSGGENNVVVMIPNLDSQGLRTVTVTYKASYPTVIITSDKSQYNANSSVGLSILVINGGEKIRSPYIETEVYSSYKDQIYSTMINLDELQPLEKTETYEKFALPSSSPTGMYTAHARFREDFAIISQGSTSFFVSGVRESVLYNFEVIVLVAAGIALIYLSYRRYKSIKRLNKKLNVMKKRKAARKAKLVQPKKKPTKKKAVKKKTKNKKKR